MFWGIGPSLGLLTFVGYFLFMTGAVLAWRRREELSVWVHDEISLFRRSFSRYTTIGPFYSPRQESRLKAAPSSFLRFLKRLPFSHFNGAIIFFTIGFLLFVLDLFI
ncbi:MAG TPA: hypothetical protein VMO76_04860 [Candidatus Udaeobacter sp.]|jgi:hypothetical protein|nr:hypothetical protein [Candidatus Udaeobacter sp.]